MGRLFELIFNIAKQRDRLRNNAEIAELKQIKHMSPLN